MTAAATHGLTALDDRHFGLLTLIVLSWLTLAYIGVRAERAGVGFVVALAAAALVVCMAAASVMLGLGAVQWWIAACAGIAWERRR